MLNFKPLSHLQKKFDRVNQPILESQRSAAFWLGIGIIGIIGTIALKGSLWDRSIVTAWLEVPNFSNPYYALLPSFILLAAAQIIIKVSPQPQVWSRGIIVSVLLFVTVRYVFWRFCATLNFSGTLNTTFSILLLTLETLMILSSIFQLCLSLKTKNRRREADNYSRAVLAGKYQPTVDILIPTYNEPAFILKKSIIGCQAIDYSRKEIYLLDDTRRPEIAYLAKELGCHYITRNDNKDAKAGNLNHATTKCRGELIAVFDADFVPTTNFLNRTVGFFQNEKNALVQTYQSFYNPDPIARNLGLEKHVTQDSEFFSRYYQPLRDAIDTAICYGSSFVVRRDSLEAIGGFVTESLSEDYFTAIKLSARGNRVVFLNESMSAGLCADNMAGHILQRLRWGRGTLQAFFIKSNPLTIKGMKPWQRLAHLEGISQWFMNVFRLIFLVVPIVCAFTGSMPWRTSIQEWLYFFLPFFLLQSATFSWLNYRSRSSLLSDVYSVIQCVPISVVVVQTLWRPFTEKFRVTPKGTATGRYYFNWQLAYPSIFLFILTALGIWYSGQNIIKESVAIDRSLLENIQLAAIWNIYNLIVLGITILVMLDVPKTDPYEWFEEKYSVALKIGDRIYSGTSQEISEIGMKIKVCEKISVIDRPIFLEIPEVKLNLPVEIVDLQDKTILLHFDRLNLTQERQLIEMLYCSPGRWLDRQAPGEIRSIYLLGMAIFAKFKQLFKPLFFAQIKRKFFVFPNN